VSLRTRISPLPAVRSRIPIWRVPQPRENQMTSTWRLARPGRIARSLAASQAQRSGGWFVAGQSTDVGRNASVTRTIAGREVVFWRGLDGALVAGPGACPHLGALLDNCPVLGGTMYCRWHGLAFTAEGDRTWSPYRAYDDGVLLWVGLPTAGEPATDRPALPARPPLSESITAVMVEPGVCEPQDVIANRLDPWHLSLRHI
jgi:nitrite reductase/ring-hydroxylating ferredoxin subunit